MGRHRLQLSTTPLVLSFDVLHELTEAFIESFKFLEIEDKLLCLLLVPELYLH
jgi:hypothetical protein